MRHELSIEQLQRRAPSAFATHPWADVSSRYTFIPTVDVIEGMRSAGFIPVDAQQSRSRIAGKSDFTKHLIRFQPLDQLNQQAVVGDSVIETILINAHDRTSRYKLMLGLFRFVCTNGLVVGSMFDSFSVRHTGDIIRDVIKSTRQILRRAVKLNETVARWQDIQMAADMQMAFAQRAHALRFPLSPEGQPSTAVTPEMLLRPRRSEDEGNSLWLTYNRIQENTIQGYSTRAVRNLAHNFDRSVRGARAVRGIDQSINLNKALWDLAAEYANVA